LVFLLYLLPSLLRTTFVRFRIFFSFFSLHFGLLVFLFSRDWKSSSFHQGSPFFFRCCTCMNRSIPPSYMISTRSNHQLKIRFVIGSSRWDHPGLFHMEGELSSFIYNSLGIQTPPSPLGFRSQLKSTERSNFWKNPHHPLFSSLIGLLSRYRHSTTNRISLFQPSLCNRLLRIHPFRTLSCYPLQGCPCSWNPFRLKSQPNQAPHPGHLFNSWELISIFSSWKFVNQVPLHHSFIMIVSHFLFLFSLVFLPLSSLSHLDTKLG